MHFPPNFYKVNISAYTFSLDISSTRFIFISNNLGNNMPVELYYLEGRKMCVVFCQLKDEETFKSNQENPEEAGFKLKCLHGRANILQGKYLKVEGPQWQFPGSAICL